MSKLLKKTFVLLAAVVMGATFVSAAPLYEGDATDGAGGAWYITVAEDGGATLQYCGVAVAGDYAIPASVTGTDGVVYPVVAIGDGVFRYNDDITSVTFPANLAKIGENAFRECTSLTNVTYLGDAAAVDCDYDAFRETPYVESFDFDFQIVDGVLVGFVGKCPAAVEIPATVTKIGESAFDEDYNPSVSNLTSVVIPASVKSLEIYAFYECMNLESLTLSEGLEEIGEWVFDSCAKLAAVTIPASVKVIDEGAFYNCALAEIVIPAGVKEIRAEAFEDCYSLTNVVLNEGLEYVGPYAFGNCVKVRNLVVPASVKTIEEYAFAWCDLRTLTLNEGLEYVGARAFEGNAKLKAVSIPASVKTLDRGAFEDCNKLATVTLAEGIEAVSARAFAYTAVTNLYLPATVKNFDPEAFADVGGTVAVQAPYAVSTLFALDDEGKITLEDGYTVVAVEFYGTEPVEFDACFHYNYGSPETLIHKNLKDGCCAGSLLPDALARAGFDFVGWNSKNDGTGVWLMADTVVAKATTDYYAIWAEQTDDLTGAKYDADGSYLISGNDVLTYKVRGGGVLTFDWKTEDLAGADGTFALLRLYCDDIYCTGSDKDGEYFEYKITRKGEWTSVSITIGPNDDEWRSWDNIPGEHTFSWKGQLDWDNDLGEWVPNVYGKANVRNIKWTEDSYTIKFDKNGGTGYADEIVSSFPYSNTATYVLTNGVVNGANGTFFYRENYDIYGFGVRSIEEWGGTVYTNFYQIIDVNTFEDGDNVIQTFTVNPKDVFDIWYYGNVTLYALWQPKQTEVTFFNYNGVEELAKYGFDNVDEVVFPSQFDVRPGMKATDWEKNGENSYKVKGWVTNEFTVSFDMDTAGTVDPISFKWNGTGYGNYVTVTTSVDRAGYTLTGFEYACKGATISGNTYYPYDYEGFIELDEVIENDNLGNTAKYVFTINPDDFEYTDVTLKAVWKENIQVVLLPNTGVLGGERTVQLRYGWNSLAGEYEYLPKTLSLTNDVKFANEGYTLTKWTYAVTAFGLVVEEDCALELNGDGDTFTVLPTLGGTDPEGEIAGYALVAEWESRTHTVTFLDDDNVEFASWEQPFGEEIVPPDSPFEGWVVKSWTPAIPATMPDKDQTFKATFKTASFTVSFDANGGTGANDAFTFNYNYDGVNNSWNADKIVVTNKVTKEGYTLAGWNYSFSYQDLDGVSTNVVADVLCETIVPANGEPFTVCTIPWYLCSYEKGGVLYTAQKDVTLTAVWVKNVVATFSAGELELIPATETLYWSSLKDGADFFDWTEKQIGTPLKTAGYTVASWNYDTVAGYDEEGNPITLPVNVTSNDYLTGVMFGFEADGETPLSGTLVANWVTNAWTVTFKNEGKPDQVFTDVPYGTTIPTPDNEVGKMVLGYSPELPATMPDSNCVFTITGWTNNIHTVSFDANGGNGTMDDVKFEYAASSGYGDPVTVTNKFTREGYSFLGWNNSATGEFMPGKVQNIASDLNGDKDVTLKAVWAKDFVITLDGGEEAVTTNLVYTFSQYTNDNFSVVITNDMLQAAGKTVVGWTYRPNFIDPTDDDWELPPDAYYEAETNGDDYWYAENLEFTILGGFAFGWDEIEGTDGAYGKPADGTFVAVWNDDVKVSLYKDEDENEVAFVTIGWADYDGIRWYQESEFTVPFSKVGYSVETFEYEYYDYIDDEIYDDEVYATLPDENKVQYIWLWADMFGLEDDTDGVHKPIDGEMVANWKVNTWTVTFKAYGKQDLAEALVVPVDYDQPIPVPDTWPDSWNRNGQAVKGWLDQDAEAAEIPVTMPDSNLVFVAEWADNKYTVTFDAGEGTLATNSVAFAWNSTAGSYGDAAVLSNVATRAGYTLGGWNYTYKGVGQDGKVTETNKFLAIETFIDGTTVTTLDPAFNTDGECLNPVYKDVTLTAEWVKNVVVTFNGGEGYEPTTAEILWDAANEEYFVTTVDSPFEKEGHLLTAWKYSYIDPVSKEEEEVEVFPYYVQTNGWTITVIAGVPTTNYTGFLEYKFDIDANILDLSGELDLTPTLNAVWTPNTANVTFYDVDGTTVLATWDQDFGTPIYEPDMASLGLSNGLRVASWTPALPPAMPDEAVSFTATGWVTNHFTVSFFANGGEGEMDSVEFAFNGEGYGDSVIVTNKFTRDGYTLAGWDYVWYTVTQADDGFYSEDRTLYADITDGVASDVFEISPDLNNNKDVTLVAKWVKDTVFTFDPNDGSDLIPPQVAVKWPFVNFEVVSNNVLTASGKSVIYWTYTNQARDEAEANGDPVPAFLTALPDAASQGVSAYLYWSFDPYIFGVDDDGLPLDGTFKAVWSDNMTFQLVGDSDDGKTQVVTEELGWFKGTVNDEAIEWYQELPFANPFSKEGQAVETWANDGETVVIAANEDGTYTFSADMFGLEADGTPKTGTLAANWVTSTHKVKFFDDPTADPYATITVEFGKAIPIPDSTYEGKMIDVNSIEPALAATMPDNDLSYNFAWTDSVFTVSFDANGGEGEMDDVVFAWDAKTKSYGAPALVPCTYTREGYTLVGWDYSFDMVAPDGTVTKLEGYIGNEILDATEDGFLVPTTEIYPKWWIDEDGNRYPGNDFYKDVVFVAKWTKNVNFTVTDADGYTKVLPLPINDPDDYVYIPDYYFANAGKTLKSLTYRPEDLPDSSNDVSVVIAWTDDEAKWFAFNAWMFTAEEYKAEPDKHDPIPGTLTATWTDNAVFTIEANDGTTPADTVELGWAQYGTGDPWYQSLNYEVTFKREGMMVDYFTYTKYRENKESQAEVKNEDWDGDGVTNHYVTLTADMFGLNPKTGEPVLEGTLTAHWAKFQPEITFSYNGGVDAKGKGEIVYPEGTYYWGDALEAPGADKIVRTGFELLGWVDDDTDEFFALGTEMTVPGKDTTFVARWSDGTTYTATFDGNGAEAGQMEAQTFFVGENTALAANAFTLTGYTFQGWATTKEKADNGKVDFADGADYVFNAGGETAVTFYAVWKLNIVKVTFDYNGITDGDGATSKDIVLPYGSAITAPDIVQFAPDGLFFYGWDPEFTGTVPAEDTTYVAVWTPPVFNIEFNKNSDDAVGSMEAQEFESGVAEALNANGFSRTGYTFQGWATSADGEVLYTDGQTVTLKGPATFYAIWAINTYKVEFNYAGGVDADGNTSLVTNLEYGAAITAPADPTRENYVFAGWTPAVAATVPASDVTYTAKWDVITGLWITPYDQESDLNATVSLKLADVFVIDSVDAEGKDVEVTSLSISGLPSGVKYDKKSQTFSGTAKKAGIYYVKCTAKNKEKFSYVATAVWNVGNTPSTDTDAIGLGDDLKDALSDLMTGFSYEFGPEEYEKLAQVKSVSGLPTGLKFAAKTQVIAGTPTKAGKYTVKFKSTSGAESVWTVIVTDSAMYRVTILDGEFINDDGDSQEAKIDAKGNVGIYGTAKGAGVYAVGKKITLKATAKKGYAFAGWYDADSGDLLSLDASYPMYLTEMGNVNLTTKFVTEGADKASIALSVNETSFDEALPSEPWTLTAGVKVEWPVEQSALSATKVTASGLPSGLKLVQDKVTKAYTIYGAPTAASKPGKPSNVKLTVKSTRGSKVYQFQITVNALPDWVVGAFNGLLTSDAGDGLVQSLSVTSAGKVSGKLVDKDGKVWTLTAPWLDEGDGDVFSTQIVSKNGKVAVTNQIEVTSVEVSETKLGFVTGAFGVEDAAYDLEAVQNIWKTAWKDKAKTLSGKTATKTVDVKGTECSFELKVGSSGTVKVAGTYNGTKLSNSTVLIPVDSGYMVWAFFPKNGFGVEIDLTEEDLK